MAHSYTTIILKGSRAQVESMLRFLHNESALIPDTIKSGEFKDKEKHYSCTCEAQMIGDICSMHIKGWPGVWPVECNTGTKSIYPDMKVKEDDFFTSFGKAALGGYFEFKIDCGCASSILSCGLEALLRFGVNFVNISIYSYAPMEDEAEEIQAIQTVFPLSTLQSAIAEFGLDKAIVDFFVKDMSNWYTLFDNVFCCEESVEDALYELDLECDEDAFDAFVETYADKLDDFLEYLNSQYDIANTIEDAIAEGAYHSNQSYKLFF